MTDYISRKAALEAIEKHKEVSTSAPTAARICEVIPMTNEEAIKTLSTRDLAKILITINPPYFTTTDDRTFDDWTEAVNHQVAWLKQECKS